MAPDQAIKPPLSSSSKAINRREFLYYLGGASLLLLTAEACSAITSFALPHERLGVDFFQFGIDRIPTVGSAILGNQFYLSNTENGLFALSSICSQPACYVKFVDHQFICPCCCGHFDMDGTFLGNSFACRDFARFVIQANTSCGIVATSSDGAVSLQGVTKVTVHVHQKILGQLRSQVAECNAHR